MTYPPKTDHGESIALASFLPFSLLHVEFDTRTSKSLQTVENGKKDASPSRSTTPKTLYTTSFPVANFNGRVRKGVEPTDGFCSK